MAKAAEDQTVATQLNEPTRLPVRRELQAGAPVRAIIPTSMEDAYRIAQAVVKAGMAPKGMETPEKCLIAIMQGLEVNLTPLQSIQRIAVINGRPTIWGDAAIGLVRASGLCLYVHEHIEGEGNQMKAFCEVKRKGEDRPIIASFSVEDAVLAGLWGKAGPWVTHPKRMLQMRARGFALRDGFADVLGGMYLREELEDDDMRDVTPQPQPQQPNGERPRTVEDMMEEFAKSSRTAEALAESTPALTGEVIPPKKKRKDEGGMRYTDELSALNCSVLVDALVDLKTLDEIEEYLRNSAHIIDRLTPLHREELQKKVIERRQAINKGEAK